jgi:hypothetical protein
MVTTLTGANNSLRFDKTPTMRACCELCRWISKYSFWCARA